MSEETIISFHRDGGDELVLGNGAIKDRFLLIAGSLGLGMAPTSFESSPVLGGHGSILRGVRLDEHDVFVPVLVDARSITELNEFRERLRKLFSPLDERELTIRVRTSGYGDEWRELPIRYAGGLEGDFDPASFHGDWQVVGLKFRTFDALWRGAPLQFERSVITTSKPFLGGTSFFPVELSGSTIVGQVQMWIAGDAPTAPVWTITPPGNSIALTHLQSGATFNIATTITETIFIDMETSRVWSASKPNNELWDAVPFTSSPFELMPGDNVLDVVMPGATAASKVTVEYRPRYLGGS